MSSFFQLRPNTWVFRRLPFWASRWYLHLVGRLYFLLSGRQKKAILTALAHYAGGRQGLPGLRQLWPAVRAGIFEHYHEKLLLGFKPYEVMRDYVLEHSQVRGLAHLEDALAQGKGVILITGHFGAVEYLPGALAWRNQPVTVMVHCKTPALRQRLEERARLAGTKLLDPKAQTTFFQALEHLRQGRILLTQCDEISMWKPYPDRSINFLGVSMGLDRSLDLLARKAKCPVVFGLMHRLGRGRFELVLDTIDPGQAPARARLVSAACLSRLDQIVYAQPAAWYEWAKLAPLLQPLEGEAVHEDNWLHRIPGEMALPDACGT